MEEKNNKTGAARRSDWKTSPMPEQCETFVLTRSFSGKEREVLRRGHVPEAMEDKWFRYMEGSTLWAHRSWSGFCIYRIDLGGEDTHLVTVNRDPEQYRCTDIEEDRETLDRLLDDWTRSPGDYYSAWLAEIGGALEKAGRGRQQGAAEKETVAYYDRNAAQYVSATAGADLRKLRSRFLRYVKPGGTVLDAGCGSGRDAAAFLRAGFRTEAFDASREMCRLASERLGIPVACRAFEELEGREAYDGIWCCASLLHVRAEDLPAVMRRLAGLLKPGGAIYVSFKEGSGEHIRDGRYYHDMTAGECRSLLEEAGLAVREVFLSGDVRKGRGKEQWVNAIAKKGAAETGS